jgi:hypothetical protein
LKILWIYLTSDEYLLFPLLRKVFSSLYWKLTRSRLEIVKAVKTLAFHHHIQECALSHIVNQSKGLINENNIAYFNTIVIDGSQKHSKENGDKYGDEMVAADVSR